LAGENLHARETGSVNTTGSLVGPGAAIAAAGLRVRACGDKEVTWREIGPSYREPARSPPENGTPPCPAAISLGSKWDWLPPWDLRSLSLIPSPSFSLLFFWPFPHSFDVWLSSSSPYILFFLPFLVFRRRSSNLQSNPLPSASLPRPFSPACFCSSSSHTRSKILSSNFLTTAHRTSSPADSNPPRSD
jgi:hypothetical protein